MTKLSPLLLLFLFLLLPADCLSDDSSTDDKYDNYFSIGAHLNAEAFSKHFRSIFRRSLHVDQFEKFLQTQQFDVPSLLDSSVLSTIGDRLDVDLSDISRHLTSLVVFNSTEVTSSCNNIHDVINPYNERPCAIYHKHSSKGSTTALKPLLSTPYYVRRQFLYSEDIQQEYPSEFLSLHSKLHWSSILSLKVSPTSRNIVIVMELGSITQESQLESMKNVAKHLLETSLSTDYLTIISTSGSTIVRACQQGKNHLKKATPKTIRKLQKFVDEQRLSEGVPSHGYAIQKAFEELGKMKDVASHDKLIQYISRGTLEELSDASNIMKQLAETVLKVNFKVKINTILIADDNRNALMWPVDFMSSLAMQNFSRYKFKMDEAMTEKLLDYQPITGQMVIINKPITTVLDLNTLTSMLTFTSRLPGTSSPSWFIQPKHYGRDDDVIMTIVDIVEDVIVGMDFSSKDFFWSVIHSTLVQYAPPHLNLVLSMTSSDGYIMTSSGSKKNEYLYEVDRWPLTSMWLLNNLEGSDAVSGEFDILTTEGKKFFYYWKKMNGKPFVVIMRSDKPLPEKMSVMLSKQDKQMFEMDHLIWHLNTEESNSFCVTHGERINPTNGAVYLPSSVYHYSIPPSTTTQWNNWVFLSDKLGLIRSSSMISGIREDVGLLGSLVRLWIQDQDNDLPVIRRFIVSRRGPMLVFPATSIVDHFEPTQQLWYQKSMETPGKIVVVGPRLDKRLGDVVTITSTVHFGSKSSDNNIVAVVGIDISAEVFRVLLAEAIPNCATSRRCVLFTPSGSVIHSTIDGDKARSPSDVLERYHISHLEPVLAHQMINNDRLVHKNRCRSDNGVERFFQWNTSYSRVHTTFCGSSSTSYSGAPIQNEVLLVPNTNLFLAMINVTCNRSTVPVFCPCSVNDRRCLFCGRFDRSECECPCQCYQSNQCSDVTNDQLPICPPKADYGSMSVTVDTPATCVQQTCSSKLHMSQCLLTSGCSWCEFHPDGRRKHASSCLQSSSCYQGVEGRSPSKSSTSHHGEEWVIATPMGPLAAGIMILFIMLTVVVYCYRSQVNQLITRRSFSDGAPLFHGTANYDYDLDSTLFKEEKQSVQLASFEREAPPAVAANRRVESDHGYSTMTDRNTVNEETESSASTATGPRFSLKVHQEIREPTVEMTTIITSAVVHADAMEVGVA